MKRQEMEGKRKTGREVKKGSFTEMRFEKYSTEIPHQPVLILNFNLKTDNDNASYPLGVQISLSYEVARSQRGIPRESVNLDIVRQLRNQ